MIETNFHIFWSFTEWIYGSTNAQWSMNIEASLLHQVNVSLENKRFIYLDSEAYSEIRNKLSTDNWGGESSSDILYLLNTLWLCSLWDGCCWVGSGWLRWETEQQVETRIETSRDQRVILYSIITCLNVSTSKCYAL